MSNNTLSFKKVSDRKQVELFHRVQHKLYEGNPYWSPGFRFETEAVFDPQKNELFQTGECERYLVFRGQELCGRFAVMINPEKDEKYSPKMGGVGFLEFVQEQEIADGIIEFAKNWFSKRNYSAFRLPVNFGENDTFWGLLIENFEDANAYGLQYHHPYYKEMLEAAGGEKHDDMFCYRRDFETPFSERLVRIKERVEQNDGVHIRPIDKKNLQRDAGYIREIYNQAWAKQEISSREEEFTPLTEETVQTMIGKLKPVLIPELCPLVFVNGTPASFIVSIPDLNEFAAQTKGKIRWWQLPKLYFFKNQAERVRTIALGTKPEYRRMGLEVLAFLKGIEWGRQKWPNVKRLEGGWISEKNWLMQRSVEAFGCQKYKTYRVYKWEF